jgi:hypothetical protein
MGNLISTLFTSPGPGGVIVIIVIILAAILYSWLTSWILRGGETAEEERQFFR